MRDLLFLLHQVQPIRDDDIVLVFVLAHLEQDLDHVLTPLADGPFVQHRAEPLKYGIVCLGRVLREKEADLAHEADGDLDAVVRGPLEAQEEDLERDELVRDVLIDEVRNKGGRGVADCLCLSVSRNAECARRCTRVTPTHLVIPLVRPPELADQAHQQELAHLRQLCIDDGHQSGKDRRKGKRGRLGAHDAPRKESLAADEVLAEKLGHNVLDVRDVDLFESAVSRAAPPCTLLPT